MLKKALLLSSLAAGLLGTKTIQAQDTCTASNLWVNGNFENTSLGNHCSTFNPVNIYSSSTPFLGFTTFTYIGSGPVIQAGVLNEPTSDHTTGLSSGHYLYLDPRNATGSTYQIRQTIKVKPGTTYNFSTWATSMLTSGYSSLPATIQLVVNGITVSTPLTVNGIITNWVQLSGTWNSGSNTSATVDIVAISPSIGGHDFAIDDIFFGAGTITSDAGQDATVCLKTQHTLGGAPTADYGATCNGEYTYSWSPTTGFLTASNIANPIIEHSTPGVYTYTVTVTDLNGQSCQDEVTIKAGCDTIIKCDVDNLWVNGTFENTNVGNHCDIFNPVNAHSASAPFFGFTTFTYIGSGPVIQPGVLNEPTSDHTTGLGSGHYLYLDPRNASGSTYQIRQNIKVKPSTTYTFSTWITSTLTSTYSSNPANVQLVVNGTPVSAVVTASGTVTNWFQVSGTWNSGSNTTAVADIVALNPSVGGHDFAIDDIYFGSGDIEVNAGADATICMDEKHVLGGQPTADFGATCNDEYTYDWNPTTGFITANNIANPTVQISVPGIYTYTVTVTDLNGQTCQDKVVILVDKCKDGTPGTSGINGLMDDKKNITVYPNPNKGKLFVSLENEGSKNNKIYVYDYLGKLIQEQVLRNTVTEIDITSLIDGVYYYSVKNANGAGLKNGTIIKTK
jgi:hypothetical protein